METVEMVLQIAVFSAIVVLVVILLAIAVGAIVHGEEDDSGKN